MTRHTLPPATRRARRLRRQMTEVEAVLWNELRRMQMRCRFRRQESIGPFVVDFVCKRHPLVIEIDGSQHMDSRYDAARTKWLEGAGYTVIRFWNHEVLGNLDMVTTTIASHIPAFQSTV